MALSYSWLTFVQARAALAARLSDPGSVFWTDTELGLYIIEALRTWNSLTAFYKDRGTFSTTAGVRWYDIPATLPALRAYTVTDVQILTQIEYHLMEPPTGATWTGSEMFSVSDILAAIQRRRDQFLNESGSVIVTKQDFGVFDPVDGIITFQDTVIDIRRIGWAVTGSYIVPLWREDIWALNSYFTQWRTVAAPGAIPRAWAILTNAPLAVQLAPIPDPTVSNNIEVLQIEAGATLDGTGVPLGIPDDLSWVVKWGALADLLRKDGPARDPARAKYCEERWAQGIALAKMPVSTVAMYLAGQSIPVETVFELDTFRASWEAPISGTPTLVGMAGLNLLAFSPIPNASYTVFMDLLSNMPVPSADGDYIQIGREMWDSVLAYAEHLAAWKMAGAEFTATMPCMEEMLRIALVQNERLRANQFFMTQLHDRANREEKLRPRVTPER